ncbi:hypothetical protein RHMOL_Rhmol02G0282000 [Rhododendron molle]|uniref:Uncharacterized protein n=1 Tax=Rhododendron molle TaxID=49168 RepID=A0ACC0PVH3_RHOML|nr:hypothetical protein RHMOL_Rhmol02G0282000 [Rhododendron molle]
MGDDLADLDDDTDNTNELDSHSSSDTDDDGRKQKKKKHAIFNEEADILNPVFSVGMEFKTHEIFRDAVKEHSIKLGKKIKFKKSDRAKVCAVCEGKEDCPWYIYASFVKNDGLYRIKRYVDQHTCTRSYHVPWVSTKWIVKRYSDKICKNPTWPIQSLAETIESENTVNVDRQKVFRARRRSLAILEGDAKQQFRELFGYIDEVRSTNPGTTIKVEAPNDQYRVDLKNKTCGCRRWELSGIPCVHAIAAYNKLDKDPMDYVHSCYNVQTYLKTYGNVLGPINGRDMWPSSGHQILLPPDVKKRAGKPKKVRRREPDEDVPDPK